MTNELKEKILQSLKYKDSQVAKHILVEAAHDKNLKLDRKDYLMLSYVCLNSLDEDRVLALLKESMLVAYDIDGFDFCDKVFDYIELLYYPEFIINFLYKLREILSQSQELLSEQKITVKGVTSIPTIKNWLLDYQSMTKLTDRDALDEVNYMNTSSNVQRLTVRSKQILQNLIKIFDRVSRYIEFWEGLPEKLSPEEQMEFESYFNELVKNEQLQILSQEQSSLEKDSSVIQEDVEEIKTGADPSVQKMDIRPVEPVVAPRPVIKPLEPLKPQVQSIELPKPVITPKAPEKPKPTPVSEVKPTLTEKEIVKTVIPQKPTSPPEEKPELFSLGKDIDQEEQEKRGIVYDQTTNVDLHKIEALAKEHQQKQQDIANKLEDLKKRRNRDDK